MPEGVQHLKGDVKQVLVEEVHHVLAQAVAPIQALTAPPAHMQCPPADTLIGIARAFIFKPFVHVHIH